LKDESSEIDLVGPTFPALKAILDLPRDIASDSQERYQRLVHGLLSSCLLNVDAMRSVVVLIHLTESDVDSVAGKAQSRGRKPKTISWQLYLF